MHRIERKHGNNRTVDMHGIERRKRNRYMDMHERKNGKEI